MRGFLKLSSPITVLALRLAVSFPLAWLRGGDGAGCHFSARAHANPTRSILSGPCEEWQKALPPMTKLLLTLLIPLEIDDIEVHPSAILP
jgi:hypothetical protein